MTDKDQKNKKIFFIMNTLGLTGGVKAIFEHANLLSEKSYEVNLVHLLNIDNNVINFLKALMKKLKYKITKYARPNWFKLNEKIKILRLININKLKLSIDDIIIATSNETADFVSLLKSNSNHKFYFIQDYESWTRDNELVDKTYKYNNLEQITTTKTLASLLKDKFNKEAHIVEYGVNQIFFLEQGKEKEISDSINILMLFHFLPKKGFEIGLEAIKELKSKYKNIKLNVFGAYQIKSKSSIDNFYFKPSQEELRNIYKQTDIFLYPALEEGFGITLMEAAASKCAIITTNVGWAKEYGKDFENMMFIKKNNIEDIVEKIEILINDKTLREKLGQRANILAKDFSWEKSNNKFEKIIIKNQ